MGFALEVAQGQREQHRQGGSIGAAERHLVLAAAACGANLRP